MGSPLPSEPPGGAVRTPLLPAAWLLGLLTAWTGLVALETAQSVLGILASGGSAPLRFLVPPRLLDLAWGALYVPLLLVLVRRPPARGVAHLALLLAAAAAFAAVQAAWGTGLERALLGPVVFHGSRAAKGISAFLSFAVLAGIAYLLEFRRRLAERETVAAQLQARLSQARLDALAAQLQPHFLFNTLNALSVLIHRDPAAADLMLTRLADLLRATLRAPAAHEVPLRDEMALLGRYLDIMRIRYGPRLVVETDVPAELEGVLVPPFLLQPLVENALEHGVARRAGEGRVEIAAAAADGRLRLTVTDDGPGAASDVRPGGEGIGLGNTRGRLEQLYGDRQRLVLERVPGAGTRVEVELPLRRAVEAAR